MKAALYCRVSTDEQKKNGVSIDAQKDSLIKYCEHNNFEYDLFIDEGFSGGKWDRPSLQDLLTKANDYELVLITRLDRLSRSVKDANIIAEQLQKSNCGLIALNGDINGVYSPADKFRFNIMLSVAQFEREADAEKINANNRYKALVEGTAISGKKILGYDINEQKRYVINEKEAKLVKLIFEKVIEYGSIRSAYAWYKNNYGYMEYTRFRRILNRRKYTGEYNYKGEITTKLLPPIISIELYEKAQEMIKKNIRTSRSNRIYYFTSLMKCPKCGKAMTSTTQGGYKYYRCNRANQKNCEFKTYFSENTIVKFCLSQIPILLNEIEINVTEKNKKIKPLDYNYYNNKKNRIKELFIDGIISKEEFNSRTKEIDNIIKEYEIKTKKTNINEFKEKLNALEIYNRLDDIHKRAFWQSIIDRIEVIGKDNYKLYLKFD